MKKSNNSRKEGFPTPSKILLKEREEREESKESKSYSPRQLRPEDAREARQSPRLHAEMRGNFVVKFMNDIVGAALPFRGQITWN